MGRSSSLGPTVLSGGTGRTRLVCSHVISPSSSWDAPQMTPLLAFLDCVMFPGSPMLLFSRSIRRSDVSCPQRDVLTDSLSPASVSPSGCGQKRHQLIPSSPSLRGTAETVPSDCSGSRACAGFRPAASSCHQQSADPFQFIPVALIISCSLTLRANQFEVSLIRC